MIQTARQLKDKIRNLSNGESGKSQILIRNYAMERFLDRLSKSEYKSNFILKGGMLVSSLVGLDKRGTMDIDTTVKNIPLNEADIRRIFADISGIDTEDNMSFEIKSVSDIMDDMDYPGLRFMIEAKLENMIIPLKIDVSTDDIITPGAVDYEYKTMFGDAAIHIQAYNIETILAEKIETILSKGLLNTRMRDFYDIYILSLTCKYDSETLKEALKNTSEKRNSSDDIVNYEHIIENLSNDRAVEDLWSRYKNGHDYADTIEWSAVIETLTSICADVIV
ncbi:MAG: nucleotidyl transferase AbiEii/AbiGii toxin family protein [Clostridia bacterium]|nr:nucleotidyl transferase AbiEii/AbiGii toxin family protein [Clostridia bacterium]